VDHKLQIDASRVIATDGILIPTGELINVTGTHFDFRNETGLGYVIDKAIGYCGTGERYKDGSVDDVLTICLKQVALAWIMLGSMTVQLRTGQPFLYPALTLVSSEYIFTKSTVHVSICSKDVGYDRPAGIASVHMQWNRQQW
jgi:hypothetical protein